MDRFKRNAILYCLYSISIRTSGGSSGPFRCKDIQYETYFARKKPCPAFFAVFPASGNQRCLDNSITIPIPQLHHAYMMMLWINPPSMDIVIHVGHIEIYLSSPVLPSPIQGQISRAGTHTYSNKPIRHHPVL